MSQVLIDVEIYHEEYKSILNERENYRRLTENIRMMEGNDEKYELSENNKNIRENSKNAQN